MNANAIDLLKENLDNIDWVWINNNYSIFELDYEKMKLNKVHMKLEEELIKEVMKPSRVFKNYDYLEELFGD